MRKIPTCWILIRFVFVSLNIVLMCFSTFGNEARNILTLRSQLCRGEGGMANPSRNPVSLFLPQISEIYVCGESADLTAKEKLLLWSQQAIEGYPGLRCVNFTSSWSDGRMFNALLHRYRLGDEGRD